MASSNISKTPFEYNDAETTSLLHSEEEVVDLTGTKTVGIFTIIFVALRSLLYGDKFEEPPRRETMAAAFSSTMCFILQCAFFAAIIQTTIGDYEWVSFCPEDADWACTLMFLAICGFYTNRAVMNLIDIYDDKFVIVRGGNGFAATLDFAHEAIFSNAVFLLNLNLVAQQTSVLMIFFKTTTFEWLTKMDDGVKSKILATRFKRTLNLNLQEEAGGIMEARGDGLISTLLRMTCNAVTLIAPFFFTGVAIRSGLWC